MYEDLLLTFKQITELKNKIDRLIEREKTLRIDVNSVWDGNYWVSQLQKTIENPDNFAIKEEWTNFLAKTGIDKLEFGDISDLPSTPTLDTENILKDMSDLYLSMTVAINAYENALDVMEAKLKPHLDKNHYLKFRQKIIDNPEIMDAWKNFITIARLSIDEPGITK